MQQLLGDRGDNQISEEAHECEQGSSGEQVEQETLQGQVVEKLPPPLFGKYDAHFRDKDGGYTTLYRVAQLILPGSLYLTWKAFVDFQVDHLPPYVTLKDMAEYTKRSLRTIELNVQRLRREGYATTAHAFRDGKWVVEKCFDGLYEAVIEYLIWEQSPTYVPPTREYFAIDRLDWTLCQPLLRFNNYRRLIRNKRPGPKSKKASVEEKTVEKDEMPGLFVSPQPMKSDPKQQALLPCEAAGEATQRQLILYHGGAEAEEAYDGDTDAPDQQITFEEYGLVISLCVSLHPPVFQSSSIQERPLSRRLLRYHKRIAALWASPELRGFNAHMQKLEDIRWGIVEEIEKAERLIEALLLAQERWDEIRWEFVEARDERIRARDREFYERYGYRRYKGRKPWELREPGLQLLLSGPREERRGRVVVIEEYQEQQSYDQQEEQEIYYREGEVECWEEKREEGVYREEEVIEDGVYREEEVYQEEAVVYREEEVIEDGVYREDGAVYREARGIKNEVYRQEDIVYWEEGGVQDRVYRQENVVYREEGGIEEEVYWEEENVEEDAVYQEKEEGEKECVDSVSLPSQQPQPSTNPPAPQSSSVPTAPRPSTNPPAPQPPIGIVSSESYVPRCNGASIEPSATQGNQQVWREEEQAPVGRKLHGHERMKNIMERTAHLVVSPRPFGSHIHYEEIKVPSKPVLEQAGSSLSAPSQDAVVEGKMCSEVEDEKKPQRTRRKGKEKKMQEKTDTGAKKKPGAKRNNVRRMYP